MPVIIGLMMVGGIACGSATNDTLDGNGGVTSESPTAVPSIPPTPTQIDLPTPIPTAPATVLTFVEVHQDNEGGVDGLDSTRSVTISPDGKHVYAAGRDDDAVSVFSRNPTTGDLTFVEIQKDGVGGVDALNAAFSVEVSPDGKHLYATGTSDDSVTVFSRNSETGKLTLVEVQTDGVGDVDGLRGVFSVVVSPDGKHLYAASSGDNAIGVFSRDSTTGALTFVEMEWDADGLAGAWVVAISPDGKHLYTAGFNDNSVAVFSRDSTTGELEFVQVQRNGAGGVEGLEFPNSVTVSPDGKHVYAVGRDDDAVVVFSRNSTTGALFFLEVHKDGVEGVDGLNGPRSVTVSPNGKHVYVTGADDDAIAMFSRNATTGILTFMEVHEDNVGSVDGLDGATSVTVSPDGKHIYAVSFIDNAVAVFSVAQTPTSN